MFTITHPQTRQGQTIQDFTITDLQSDDTDEYLCTVNDPMSTGGNLTVATSISVFLPQTSHSLCAHYSRQWNSADAYAMFI